MGEPRGIEITRRVKIPADELRFQFTRSSGPGGQHVNKASTQVELVFDVAGSPSLRDEERRRLLAKLRPYLSGEGVLRLTCQSSRSQRRNREEAVERFRALMRQALRVPKRRRPTRPTRASQERRLAAKRRRSELKRQRGSRPDKDD